MKGTGNLVEELMLFDSVVMYGICKKLSVPEINELLYEYGLETLG